MDNIVNLTEFKIKNHKKLNVKYDDDYEWPGLKLTIQPSETKHFIIFFDDRIETYNFLLEYAKDENDLKSQNRYINYLSMIKEIRQYVEKNKDNKEYDILLNFEQVDFLRSKIEDCFIGYDVDKLTLKEKKYFNSLFEIKHKLINLQDSVYAVYDSGLFV